MAEKITIAYDRGLENDLIAHLEDIVVKLGTDKPPAGVTQASGIPDLQKILDEAQNKAESENGIPKDNPHFLGFLERIRYENENILKVNSARADFRYHGKFDGADFGRRSIRQRAFLDWYPLMVFAQYKDGAGWTDAFRDYVPHWANRNKQRILNYSIGRHIDYVETGKARRENPVTYQIHYKKAPEGEGWFGKQTRRAVQIGTIPWRLSGLDLPRVILRTMPTMYSTNLLPFGWLAYTQSRYAIWGATGLGAVPATWATAGAFSNLFGYEFEGSETAGEIFEIQQTLGQRSNLLYQGLSGASFLMRSSENPFGYIPGYALETAINIPNVPADLVIYGSGANASPLSSFSYSSDFSFSTSDPGTVTLENPDEPVLLKTRLEEFVTEQRNQPNPDPVYTIDPGYTSSNPLFADDDKAEEDIFNQTLNILVRNNATIDDKAKMAAAWKQAHAEIAERDRKAVILATLKEALQDDPYNYTDAQAANIVNGDIVDYTLTGIDGIEPGALILAEDYVLNRFQQKQINGQPNPFYQAEFDSPGKDYTINPVNLRQALTEYNRFDAVQRERKSRYDAALLGYVADNPKVATPEKLSRAEKLAARNVIDSYKVPGDPSSGLYTEDELKGPTAKSARTEVLLTMQADLKKQAEEKAEEEKRKRQTGAVTDGDDYSIDETKNTIRKSLHRLTDIEGDSVSEFGPYIDAGMSGIEGAFNWVSDSMKGEHGKRAQVYTSYGIGLVAALIGTPILKNVLGISNWPLVGLVIASVLFFGGSNMAYASMAGDDGDAGDGTGAGSGDGHFMTAAQKSTLAQNISNDGTKVQLAMNLDTDPENEEIALFDRNKDGFVVAQVKDTRNGQTFVATKVLDLRNASDGTTFTPTGDVLKIEDSASNQKISLDIIDEGGKLMSVMNINGIEHKIEMLPENEAMLKLNQLDPVPSV